MMIRTRKDENKKNHTNGFVNIVGSSLRTHMDLCESQMLRLSSPNVKTLHLVRHAQGVHNVALEEHGEKPESEKLFDAPLSQKGLQQASERRKRITESGLLNTIELVITSPLRRAMETSIGIFRGKEDINISDDFPKANNFPPILALEICRERMGLYPCDRRATITTSRTCFPEIDFAMIESDEDALWQDKEREKLDEVAIRGRQFLKWLWERPEKEIAIVSHEIFLQQTLLALHEKVGIPLEDRLLTRFANCELRSIQIEKSHMEADTLITACNCRNYVTPPSTSIHTEPTHLVIMVNGLMGSPKDWRFAAKQLLKKYPQDLVVHCSKCNQSTKTFVGLDVMGERLAEEVRTVIKCHPSLQKISFVGHSLGGLIARYAIGRLYEQELKQNSDDIGDIEEPKERIAGLEPVYFITSASPHLGSIGHKQVSLFFGSHALERLARRMSWRLGQTVKHLFLADRDGGKPPLLIRMVYDSRDLKFISALRCFKRLIVYANENSDPIVGWSTSSIRRHNELPELQGAPVNEKYPHIVNVEAGVTANNHKEDRSRTNSNGFNNFNMEEEMIRELTKLSWERVDVSFRGTPLSFLAHNHIQVTREKINSDGADVIQHMVDNFEP